MNKRIIFARRCAGKILADLQIFCNKMCLQNHVSQKSYDAENTLIYVATSSADKNSIHNAVLHESTIPQGGFDKTGVGFDTWKTMGHHNL